MRKRQLIGFHTQLGIYGESAVSSGKGRNVRPNAFA